MGIIETKLHKALQPLLLQQKENFEKIEEKFDILKDKVKEYVTDEVKKQLEQELDDGIQETRELGE